MEYNIIEHFQKRLYEENGIKLCVIPYTYTFQKPEELEKFIKDWVKENFDLCLVFTFITPSLFYRFIDIAVWLFEKKLV